MDNQASSLTEKKLAYYETVYKENVLSKPLNINVSVTESGISGFGYICDQIGTKEDEPLYSRYNCGFDEITKIYINQNNRLAPIYVQCADNSTGVMNRRRIILAGFKNSEEIVKVISDAKNAFDQRKELEEESDNPAVISQAAIYSEKKLAYFETVYRENMLSKPQDINITVTAQHIYGIAYICDQTGIKEDDPTYSRFTCGLGEITKIYINNNNKMAPIYIQCDDDSNGVMNRRRIILPKFENNDAIIKAINDAKAEFDNKLEIMNERKLREREAIRRAQDDEFESMTSGYKDMIKSSPKHSNVTAPASKSAPAPAPAPNPAPAPAPAPKSAPAPAPAPKPAPASAPAPKPAPAPAPEPKPAPTPTPVPNPAPKVDSVTVEDILGLDDILGIRADDMPQVTSFMDEISEEPDEEEINSMPVETIQKNPDKIEELSIPVTSGEYELKEVREEKISAEIEELDPTKEIAKRFAPKQTEISVNEHESGHNEPVAAAEKPESEDNAAEESVTNDESFNTVKSVENTGAAVVPNAESMSLEDFEAAVKKLKTMLDNGVISESEFAVEKKKLFKLLY